MGRRRTYKIIYSGVERWIDENNVTVLELSNRTGRTGRTIYNCLYGFEEPTKDTIDRILAVTSLSYKEAFGQNENEA